MDVLKQLFLINKNLRRIVEGKLGGKLTFLEFKFLRLVYFGGKTQKELVELTGMTKGTVSKVLSSLEGKGLVVRVRRGRNLSVEITERGRNLMKEFDCLAEEIQKTLLRGFNEEDVERLDEFLRRMAKNLEVEGENED